MTCSEELSQYLLKKSTSSLNLLELTFKNIYIYEHDGVSRAPSGASVSKTGVYMAEVQRLSYLDGINGQRKGDERQLWRKLFSQKRLTSVFIIAPKLMRADHDGQETTTRQPNE